MVIPTLGTRLEILERCLTSLDQGVQLTAIVVGPKFLEAELPKRIGEVQIEFLEESLPQGAANAIALGLKALDGRCEFISWLGDDDYLLPNSLSDVQRILRSESPALLIGRCLFLGSEDRKDTVWSPGRFIHSRLRFWWNPIAQPGSWFSAQAYDSVGGLDPKLKFAFDQDLWHRLLPMGFTESKEVLAAYSFEPGTLSFDNSHAANLEAIAVRMRHASPILRPIIKLMGHLHLRLARLLRPAVGES